MAGMRRLRQGVTEKREAPMPKNSQTNDQPTRGRQVIEETAQLLRQMRFSSHQGAYAESQHVAVSVDPRWNKDDETLRVLITCYAFGHRSVDWGGLPVQVLPEEGGVYAIVRLNGRGQAIIPRLPAGEYGLSLRTKPVRVALVLFRQPEHLAAQGEGEQEERRVWRGEGEEGAVLWTIEETEEGDIQIAFETSAEQL